VICVPSELSVEDIMRLSGLILGAAAWFVGALAISHRRGYIGRARQFLFRPSRGPAPHDRLAGAPR